MSAHPAPPWAGYGIRPAEPGAVAALLAPAFAGDPVMAWMIPAADRERRIARCFRLAQRQQRPRAGAVRVAATGEGRLLAAALWSGPGRWKPSAVQELVALPRYASILGLRGMQRAGEIRLPEGGPTLWPMWRDLDPAAGRAIRQGASRGSSERRPMR
ncbi:hypothetical protein [Streptomyces sp. DSM 40907]|uniref:hypothetical protein n=1 Tax=Streptomyces kutzneri TaxID=3051179 RepID=UPI0028D67458|nr:hypothetical protein [Streptomyces sp. DSM 40907]